MDEGLLNDTRRCVIIPCNSTVREEEFCCRLLGRVAVKGKSEAVNVYEVYRAQFCIFYSCPFFHGKVSSKLINEKCGCLLYGKYLLIL